MVTPGCVVAVDVPGVECTLSTIHPIGAHLTLHLRTTQAAELYERLRRLLIDEEHKA